MRNVSVVLLLVASIVGAEDWGRFRGPNGSGVSASTGFPTEFGKQKNLLWRTPVRQGKSSPVLTRRHIFLTGFEDGKLYTQCFDRETGKLLWERAVNRARTESVNPLNHPAAITPVADGDNVYAFFYEYGLVSYSPSGELRWVVTPRWVRVKAQPIFIGDVLAYLMAALKLEAGASRMFEIGGPDVVSYGDLMREYAQQRGLRRWMIPVPVLTPRLSSLWLGLVTPLYARVGRELADKHAASDRRAQRGGFSGIQHKACRCA